VIANDLDAPVQQILAVLRIQCVSYFQGIFAVPALFVCQHKLVLYLGIFRFFRQSVFQYRHRRRPLALLDQQLRQPAAVLVAVRVQGEFGV